MLFRYGIMEKLKRLQAGEDVEELLAEIDEELPSDDEEEDLEEAHLTKVQKKVLLLDKMKMIKFCNKYLRINSFI